MNIELKMSNWMVQRSLCTVYSHVPPNPFLGACLNHTGHLSRIDGMCKKSQPLARTIPSLTLMFTAHLVIRNYKNLKSFNAFGA